MVTPDQNAQDLIRLLRSQNKIQIINGQLQVSDGSTTAIVPVEKQSQVVNERVVRQRQTKKIRPILNSRFKVLFTVEDGESLKFYVGGDRETPYLITSLAASAVGSGASITNTGPRLNDWIACIQVSVGESQAPRLYYGNKNPISFSPAKSVQWLGWGFLCANATRFPDSDLRPKQIIISDKSLTVITGTEATVNTNTASSSGNYNPGFYNYDGGACVLVGPPTFDPPQSSSSIQISTSTTTYEVGPSRGGFYRDVASNRVSVETTSTPPPPHITTNALGDLACVAEPAISTQTIQQSSFFSTTQASPALKGRNSTFWIESESSFSFDEQGEFTSDFTANYYLESDAGGRVTIDPSFLTNRIISPDRTNLINSTFYNCLFDDVIDIQLQSPFDPGLIDFWKKDRRQKLEVIKVSGSGGPTVDNVTDQILRLPRNAQGVYAISYFLDVET
jgi:hypothetical protein